MPSQTLPSRDTRLRAEEQARRISDMIDEELKSEQAFLARKRKNEVTLLLLGQSESGKSTLQKQFQLLYAPTSLEKERNSWRSVVYVNIISTVRNIIEAVNDPVARTKYANGDLESVSSSDPSDLRSAAAYYAPSSPPGPSHTDNLQALQLSLLPLLSMEEILASELGASYAMDRQTGSREMFVRKGWQGFSAAWIERRSTSSRSEEGRKSAIAEARLSQTAQLLFASKDDVWTLWKHPIVQALLARRRLVIQEGSRVFLDDLERIASPLYVPSNEDILHARIRTVGICEHLFELSIRDRVVNWKLYDVGGTLNQRHAWIPFFEEATAIIFLAPVSAFDQYLDEDGQINRIHDSLELFSNICGHALLRKVHIILFLNKCDILQSKLRSGIMVNKFITSYGSRPNEPEAVLKYFMGHFTQAYAKNNDSTIPGREKMYTHATSVVDTKLTRKLIADVTSAIVVTHFKEAHIL